MGGCVGRIGWALLFELYLVYSPPPPSFFKMDSFLSRDHTSIFIARPSTPIPQRPPPPFPLLSLPPSLFATTTCRKRYGGFLSCSFLIGKTIRDRRRLLKYEHSWIKTEPEDFLKLCKHGVSISSAFSEFEQCVQVGHGTREGFAVIFSLTECEILPRYPLDWKPWFYKWHMWLFIFLEPEVHMNCAPPYPISLCHMYGHCITCQATNNISMSTWDYIIQNDN